MSRQSTRRPAVHELRPIDFVLDIQPASAGSVLIRWGQTHVICSASVEDKVPHHRMDSGGGWMTAEYAMLPGSSGQRIRRDRNGVRWSYGRNTATDWTKSARGMLSTSIPSGPRTLRHRL